MTDSVSSAVPAAPLDKGEKRDVWRAIRHGAFKTCPNCGEGKMFAGYLTVAPACGQCGQRFEGHQADDAPPYLTMFLVGHILIVPIVEMKRLMDPPLGFQLLLWLTLALAMTFILLPMTKGALIALQWANRMHGFGSDEDTEAPLRPDSSPSP